MKLSNNLNHQFDSYAVALYDMSIGTIEERKEHRLVFDKAVKAANFLGYPPHKFYERVGPGKYVYHRITNQKYAVRRISIEEYHQAKSRLLEAL